MEKKFFEAFPNLTLTGTHRDLFEQVVVERVTATKRKDLLRVYIRSERLIEKENIYAVENEIKKQFFPNDNIVIKIYDNIFFIFLSFPRYPKSFPLFPDNFPPFL